VGETAFEKHYYINQNVLLRRFWWLPVSLIIFMILLPFMDIGVSLTDVFGMSFVLLFTAALVFAILSRLMRLIVTPDGVRLQTPGMSVTTTWDNIDSIGYKVMLTEGKVEGLILRQPGIDVNSAVRAASWFNLRAASSIREHEYFLPISSILGKDWRETEFGYDLRYHAPWLFENEEE